MQAAGRLLPRDEWYFDLPDLRPEYAWLLEGFDEVGTDRQLGFGGAGPVPFSSVRAYIRDEGLRPDEARLFRAVVRCLDSVYFQHQAQRAKKK